MPISTAEFNAMQARCDAGRLKRHSDENGNVKVGVGNAFEKESELHEAISNELRRRRWYFVHSRTDRPTSQAKGVTDFIIAIPNGVTLWVECKMRGQKLRPEQYTVMHVLKALGHFHAVIYRFEDFLEYINSYAKINH